MIASIVSSLIYAKRRILVEAFSPSLKKLWREWDLRVTVLLSLTLQIVLISISNRRKYTYKAQFNAVIWCAYLLADAVATFSLGILSNGRTDLYDPNNAGDTWALSSTELTAFWAPFLLLHLGGPDTLTAFALEDNDLWLRHFLELVVQSGMAIYIIVMAWTGSRLSFMSILMFFAGIAKYGERTWALLSATNVKLREKYEEFSVPYYGDRVEIRFNAEGRNKKREGYVLRPETTNPHEFPVDLSVLNSSENISEENKLLAAYTLQKVTINIFLDSILSFSIRDKTRSLYRNMSFENAFQIIEIELGLIYDLLYTKASLLYSPCGLALRLFTFILTCLVLLLFALLDYKHKYSKVDISITFVLLVGAIILEIYSAFLAFSSDRFVAWFKSHNNISTLQISTCLSISRSPRWSNKMPQYSILSISMKGNPLPFHNIFQLLKIHDYLEKRRYVAYENVPQDFKRRIFLHFMNKVADNGELVSSNARVAEAGNGTPKFEEDPMKSILFWHIVTEVSCHLDKVPHFEHYEWIKQISRYMLYLAVMHPSMLSVGITDISFQKIVNGVAERIKGTVDSTEEACKKLVRRYYQSSEGVLDKAVHYIRRIGDDEKDLKEKWDRLGITWLEMFAHVASKCKGREHAQQLRRGGELLTHVWLLMAHFGLTDHFLISDKNGQTLRLIAK